MAPAYIAYSSCVLFGCLAGGLYPLGFAWLLEGLPESQYGYASGAFARFYGMGSIIGPTISGLSSESWGANGLFLSLTILGSISFLGIKFFRAKDVITH